MHYSIATKINRSRYAIGWSRCASDRSPDSASVGLLCNNLPIAQQLIDRTRRPPVLLVDHLVCWHAIQLIGFGFTGLSKTSKWMA